MTNQTAVDTTNELEEALDGLALQEVKRKSVAGAFSYFGRTIFLNLLGVASALILSGFLSAEDFGIYGYVTQFIGLLIFFSDIGLAASLVQKKVRPSITDYRTVFTIQQLLSWLIFLATLVLSQTPLIVDQVGSAGVWVLLALGISFPLASLKTISSIKLERKLDFSRLVLPQIVEQLAFNAILIFLAIKGYGVLAYAWAIIIRSILGAMLMFALQPWPIGFAWSRRSARELLNFGAKFQLNDLLARVKDNLFFIVLRQWLTPNQYGYLSWSKSYSMYPYNMTVQNVMAVTFPTFSRLQHNKTALKRAIEKSLFFITLVIFPMIVGLAVFIQPLIDLVPRYHKWQPAVFSFILFTIGIGWSAISSPLTNTLNAIGKVNETLKLMVLWTLLTWMLTPLLVFKVGFNGVAIANLLIAFTSVLPIFYVKKYVDIQVWPQIRWQFLAALAMAFVGIIGHSWWSRDWPHLLVGFSATTVTYLFCWLIFGRAQLQQEVNGLLKHR